jgi:hypothetical protein
LPKVIEISGRLSSPQKAKSSIPRRLGRGRVVVVVDGAVDEVVELVVVDPGTVEVVVGAGIVVVEVVVVTPGWVVVVVEVEVEDVDVLVGTTVEVVVVGAVVELVVVDDDVVVLLVLLDDVVVVPPSGRHSDTSGSGWPVSKAMTRLRPCWSAKNEPITPSQSGIELTLTEIGF